MGPSKQEMRPCGAAAQVMKHMIGTLRLSFLMKKASPSRELKSIVSTGELEDNVLFEQVEPAYARGGIF